MLKHSLSVIFIIFSASLADLRGHFSSFDGGYAESYHQYFFCGVTGYSSKYVIILTDSLKGSKDTVKVEPDRPDSLLKVSFQGVLVDSLVWKGSCPDSLLESVHSLAGVDSVFDTGGSIAGKVAGFVGDSALHADRVSDSIEREVSGLISEESEAMSSLLSEEQSYTAEQIAYMNELESYKALVDDDHYKSKLVKSSRMAASQLLKQGDVLSQSMEHLASLKQKYETVKDRADALGKPSNPLKEQSQSSRLVYGLQGGVRIFPMVGVCLSPTIGYRVTKQVLAGGSLGINDSANEGCLNRLMKIEKTL